MAELSRADIQLLEQDLPEPSHISVVSPIYGGRQGVMEYRASGDRSNPTVLMLHGLGSSSAGYRAQLAGLSQDFHVIAWNAPGFGNSSKIDRQDVSIDDYADGLTAFLQALGVRRLSALVGSSWGSVIALAFARRYKQRVGSLVLSAPNLAKGHLAGEARDAELAAWLSTADIGIPVSRATIADRLLAPTAPALVRRHVEQLRDALTNDGWRQAIRSLFTIHTPDVISEIRCPVAILAGTEDRAAPYEEHAARLLASAPSAKLHLIEGAGHMLKLEAPVRFNAVVRQMALAQLAAVFRSAETPISA